MEAAEAEAWINCCSPRRSEKAASEERTAAYEAERMAADGPCAGHLALRSSFRF